jgi:hypothetical protein
VEVLEVLVEIGVDAVDLGERRPVQLLQDRELGCGIGLQRLQRFGERLDDRGRREGIAIGLEVGLAHEMADPAIQELQLLVAQVLDHAGDVADDHRLVHRVGVDERQLVGLELRELRLLRDLARQGVVDAGAHQPLEFAEEAGFALLQRVARLEAHHLLFADVGAAGAVHQHLSDPIEHRAEGRDEAVNGDIPAIAEDPHAIARNRLSGGRFGRCRVHARRRGSGIASVRSRKYDEKGARTKLEGPLRSKAQIAPRCDKVAQRTMFVHFCVNYQANFAALPAGPAKTSSLCNAVYLICVRRVAKYRFLRMG